MRYGRSADMKPTPLNIIVVGTATIIGAIYIANEVANRVAEQDDEHWREIERMRKKENERGR